MVRMFVVLGVLYSVAANAQPVAHGSVEVMSKVDSGQAVVTFDAFTALNFRHGLAVEAFLMVSPGWGQAYFGPSWMPTDWIKFSLSVGGEQAKGEMGWRYATSLLVGKKSFTFLAIVEMNNPTFQGDGAGLFYLIKAIAHTEWLNIGLVNRRGAGIGPMVSFVIPRTPLTAWCEWVPFEPEKLDGEFSHFSRFVFGLQAGY